MSWRTRLLGVGVTAALMGAACSPTGPVQPEAVDLGSAADQTDQAATVANGGGGSGPVRRVDPRRGGFEVGFGEYASRWRRRRAGRGR